MERMLLLFAAGLLAGTMNAVAGGGTFVSLPAMIAAGLPSVAANMSSTVALLPGAISSTWAARRFMQGFGGISLPIMVVISVVGGGIGAALLLLTPSSAFDLLLPWLLLLALVTFAFGHRIGALLRRHFQMNKNTVMAVQFFLGIYGGYFGGAVGIMMLAAWTLLGGIELKSVTPARTLLTGAANSIAALSFSVSGQVWWPETLLMLVGAVGGGVLGARIVRVLPVPVLRMVILTITTVMTCLFFARAYWP